MVNAEDVFNPKDFKSIELEISMKNLTTQTEVRPGPINTLVEIGDKMLTFEFPAKCCNIKHSVFVEIRKRLPDETKSSELCSLTGKVLEAENLTDSEMRVVVNVVQVDELSWNALLNIFDSRQAQISEFLNAVRG